MANQKKITVISEFKNEAFIKKSQFNLDDSVSNSESKTVNFCDKEGLKILNNVYGDSRRIVQIIYNFLSNAIKFTNQNGTIYIIVKVIEEQEIES